MRKLEVMETPERIIAIIERARAKPPRMLWGFLYGTTAVTGSVGVLFEVLVGAAVGSGEV